LVSLSEGPQFNYWSVLQKALSLTIGQFIRGPSV